MNTLKSTIQKFCKLYGIYPSKSKGQNFLVNESVYREIIRHANLTKDDTVLEVGPGLGTLTELLAQNAKRVVAVELDKKLIEILRAQLVSYKNIEIIQGDVLQLATYNPQLTTDYKIVANLPYNITSHFIRKFLTEENKPSLMVLMLQKEVAERICAKPKDMSMLSFSVQWYAHPQVMSFVSRKDFWPEPKVDSAIIKITPYQKEKIDESLRIAQVDEKMLFRVVKWGFASKRKQLHNNISNGLYSMIKRKVDIKEIQDILEQCKIHPQVRAQELSMQDWLNLASKLHMNYKA